MPGKTVRDHKTESLNGDQLAATTMDRQALIDGLNHDLAGEYQAILMYIHYSAKLTGPFRRELRALFQAEVPDEQVHAQFLSDKIAALGGEPTTQPRPVPSANQPHEMLGQALAAEIQAIADYTVRIQQAEAFGDIGLKVTWKTNSPTKPGTRRKLNASSKAGPVATATRSPCKTSGVKDRPRHVVRTLRAERDIRSAV